MTTPLNQRSLARAIDEAAHQCLLLSAPDTRSRALTLLTGLPHAGDWLNVIPSPHWISISMTRSSVAACVIGWESHSTVPLTLVQSVMTLLIHLGITKWAVKAMVIVLLSPEWDL